MNSILSPGGVNGSTLQYSCLENFMDRRDRQTAVHRVIKNQTWLNTPAAAAKSLQSCPTLRPHRQQPTRLPRPWDSPGRTLDWVAISSSNAWKWKVKVKSPSPSRVRLLATPWTAAHQAPPSMGFPGQQYWSGVPLPSPGAPLHTPYLKCQQPLSWRVLLTGYQSFLFVCFCAPGHPAQLYFFLFL